MTSATDVTGIVLLGLRPSEAATALEQQLQSLGYMCKQVAVREEWDRVLGAENPERPVLAVLELGSNGNCGIDFCRRHPELIKQVPVVFWGTNGEVTLDRAIEAVQAGAVDVLQSPVSVTKIEAIMGRVARRIDSRGRRPSLAERPGNCEEEFSRILVGKSAAMNSIRRLILSVAPTQASVMIHGGSGTGKELVAAAIHRHSRRSEGPFIPVNMAAIPQGLAESLLFGHEKGAFTGAHQKQIGWCKAAHRGTLFLDEIGEMELLMQPKLLRFLQEGTIQRVGAGVSERVDARIITATNRDPRRLVADGLLREDLFFRLHVVPIHVPPLRERREDIEELADFFLRRAAHKHDRPVEGFSREAMALLESFHWPGNVRQLENAVERIAIFAPGPVVEVSDVPAEFHLSGADNWDGQHHPDLSEQRSQSVGEATDEEAGANLSPYQRHERAVVLDALQRADGHVVDASKLLGLGQATVYRKIKLYSIPYRRSRRHPRQPR
jgi:DNA-binding NtrC family response regulator